MTPTEKREFEELKRQVELLESATDPAFIEAIKRLAGLVTIEASSKLASSATQAVDEAGAATFNVAQPPTGFKTIGGFNFPYYT